MKQITTLIMELDKRYRLELRSRIDKNEEALPGNWFGLQQISFTYLDFDTGTGITRYRMDDNLCQLLRMPEASTCKVIVVDCEANTLHINDFGDSLNKLFPDIDHCLREVAKIKRLLKKTLYMFMLQIPT